MASLYPPGVDNPRRTHENAIKRMERFTQSDKFNQLNSIELEAHLTMFDKSFADFTSEHEKLIVKLSVPANFKLEDEFYATIQELYRSSVIKFRKQMDKVERESLLRSMARRSRDGARVRTVISGEQQVNLQQPIEQEMQQQQRDYEREQRQQHAVQMRDAAIHEQRTRQWIQRLPVDDEETKLERKRHRINQQLAEIERKQNELNERARRLEPVRNRDRSRSPRVNFQVNIPSTSRMPIFESNHPSIMSAGANNRCLTERLGDVRLGCEPNDGDVGNVRSTVVAPRSFDLRNRIGTTRALCCNFCCENHKMFECPRFKQLKRAEREQHVQMLKLCKNCFMPLEDGRHRCRFGRCENCGFGVFHNSLLCPIRHPDNIERN